MRIAFFAKRKRRTRTTGCIAEALVRAGHQVRRLDERGARRWLGAGLAGVLVRARVGRIRPDLVLIHADDIAPATLERLARRYSTALFTPDCWRSPLDGLALELARGVDLVLTVARGQVAEFEAAGVRRAAWLPEACDPSIHHPVAAPGEPWRSQVAFIGKANAGDPAYAERAELVRSICERFETRLYGAGWEELGLRSARDEVGPEEYRKVCAGADVVLGRDWTTRCDGYFSNRTWFTLACGGFLLTNYVPGLEDVFANHRELVWYRSGAECLELIAHYLERPDERRRIADAGREFVLAHRTYDHFARDLVDRVEGRCPRFPPPPAPDSAVRPPGAPEQDPVEHAAD